MFLSNFQRSLAAVLLGNLVYFLLMPVLPPALRHGISRRIPRIDLGLVIDFILCAVLYVIIGRIMSAKRAENSRR